MLKSSTSLRRSPTFQYLMLVVGCAIGAAAYPLFLTPCHIAPGGLTGVTTVINYLFPRIPVGISSLALNIPLFLVGYRYMGRSFAFRSLLATILFSLLIDILPFRPLTTDPMLASIFGGVMLGCGLGIILRAGATTGGTDMAARMLHNKMQHISVGTILFAMDCVSVVMAAVSIEVKYALYSFISIYVSGKVIDLVLTGGSHEMACYIISEKYEELKRIIMDDLDRGVTLLKAQGGYSNQERPILLCVLSAQEVAGLKEVVRSVDEKAFVFTTGAAEVLGEGFRALNPEN